jgi:hypothetical protein
MGFAGRSAGWDGRVDGRTTPRIHERLASLDRLEEARERPTPPPRVAVVGEGGELYDKGCGQSEGWTTEDSIGGKGRKGQSSTEHELESS